MDEKKVLQAIHRIEELYFESGGKCYVSFSGGKDSTVVLALIKMSIDSMVLPPDGIKAVFANTGIELQATVDFVKWCKENWYSNIEVVRPIKSFDWVLKNKGKPMKSKMRAEYINRYQRGLRSENLVTNLIVGKTKNGKNASTTKLADKDMHILHKNFPIKVANKCCEYMKKKPFLKYEKDNDIKGVITGIRMAEGGARHLTTERRLSFGEKLCTHTKGNVTYKYPIIDWSDEDVEKFIEEYKIPLSKAYTYYGVGRTGCIGCPFALDIADNLKILYQYEPKKYKASMHWLKDVYIAQNVILPFDEEYEKERKEKWANEYEPMRQEMLRKYRPNSRLIKDYDQLDIESYGL